MNETRKGKERSSKLRELCQKLRSAADSITTPAELFRFFSIAKQADLSIVSDGLEESGRIISDGTPNQIYESVTEQDDSQIEIKEQGEIDDSLDRGAEWTQPQSSLSYLENVDEKIVKIDRESTGTGESFWAQDSESGENFHFKTESEENKLHAEFLANLIYQRLGIPVAATQIVNFGGKKWLASTELTNATNVHAGALRFNPAEISQGFVADALLANRDVLGGISNSNIMESDGVLVRVDNGATFNYRGRHGSKNISEYMVPEISTMRDSDVADIAGKVFESVSDEQLRQQVEYISEVLTHDVVLDVVTQSGVEPLDFYTSVILGRINFLKERFLQPELSIGLSKLASKEAFSEKMQLKIDSELERLRECRQNLEKALTICRTTIERFEFSQQSKEDAEEPEDELAFLRDFSSFQPPSPRKMMLLNLKTQLSDLLLSRGQGSIPNELRCQELYDAQSVVYDLHNEAQRLLEGKEQHFNASDETADLLRNIEQESFKVSKEVASHVTGYDSFLKVLKLGKLASKDQQQKETGEYSAMVTGKKDKEMHQVVFDRGSFRPEYSAPSNMAKVLPVIFMTPSLHLLSEYQGMNSDGWHAYGSDHSNETPHNFSMDVGNDNLIIVTALSYKERLSKDFNLQEGELEELCRNNNIVFLEDEAFKVDGRLMTSADRRNSPEKFDYIIDVARENLPMQYGLGRLMQTGNVGDGSASYNKPLSRYSLI